MTDNLGLDEVHEQLSSEDPQDRIRAMHRLAAVADIASIPEIRSIYSDDQEPPAVRKAAEEALAVFQAIRVAVDNKQEVQLPDMSEVPEVRFTTPMLRRILIGLVALLVIFVVVDVVLIVLPAPDPTTGVTISEAQPEVLADQIESRLAQLYTDVETQQQAWDQYRAIQTLGCDRLEPPQTTSTTTADLDAVTIDQAAYPDLFESKRLLNQAITQFALVANDWALGCSTGQPLNSSDVNLDRIAQITALLDQSSAALEQARAGLQATAETPAEVPTKEGEATPEAPAEATGLPTATTEAVPAQVEPTAVPQPTQPAVDYSRYIRGMRERIDFATGGRGVAVQLQQYWQDVRNSGQSFGCRQPLSAENIQDYTSITPEIAAIDPRLNEIQTTLNMGLTLTRESLANFQQGCAANNFSGLLNLGDQQIQQAISALNQASAALDVLQAEVTSQP
jgi:hypothetical protein